jgi:hypothetical protein
MLGLCRHAIGLSLRRFARAQVHTLLKGLEKIAASADIPMLVAGDFNSTPGSAAHGLLIRRAVDPAHPVRPPVLAQHAHAEARHATGGTALAGGGAQTEVGCWLGVCQLCMRACRAWRERLSVCLERLACVHGRGFLRGYVSLTCMHGASV